MFCTSATVWTEICCKNLYTLKKYTCNFLDMNAVFFLKVICYYVYCMFSTSMLLIATEQLYMVNFHFWKFFIGQFFSSVKYIDIVPSVVHHMRKSAWWRIFLSAICGFFLLEKMLKFSRQEREKMGDEERGDFSSSEDSDSDTWDGITRFLTANSVGSRSRSCVQFATMRSVESLTHVWRPDT
jgi:hypothetical protein